MDKILETCMPQNMQDNNVIFVMVSLLKKIESDDSIDIFDHCLVDTVIYLANEYLIGDEQKIQHIKDAGFNVFAIEQDDFGWLIGCIRTEKGDIIFG
jgi:hypothetical protein